MPRRQLLRLINLSYLGLFQIKLTAGCALWGEKKTSTFLWMRHRSRRKTKHRGRGGSRIKLRPPSGVQCQSGLMCVAAERFRWHGMRSDCRSEREWPVCSSVRAYLMRWRRDWRGWDVSRINRLMVEWDPPVISPSCSICDVKRAIKKKQQQTTRSNVKLTVNAAGHRC